MPQEVFEKWGFGLAPPKSETERRRALCAERVLALLEAVTSPSRDDLEAISEVKGLFNRVMRQDQWDWFSVARQLGYPSTRVSGAMGIHLSNLRAGLKNGNADVIASALSILRRLPTRKCLTVFLGRAAIIDEENAGWVYILSTRELRDLLKIGMTTRTVEERVREINGATGVAIPFGVRACWRVREPSKVEKFIHTELHHSRIRGDREFFRMEFSDAKKTVIDLLQAHSLEIRTLDNLYALAES